MPENYRRSGALRERVHFQKRGDGDDGLGTVIPGAGDWETQFTAYASMRPLRGSESVMADRLSGVQPYVLTIRHQRAALGVTTAWRIVDARNDKRTFGLRSPLADPDGRNQWLEGLVSAGTADAD